MVWEYPPAVKAPNGGHGLVHWLIDGFKPYNWPFKGIYINYELISVN